MLESKFAATFHQDWKTLTRPIENPFMAKSKKTYANRKRQPRSHGFNRSANGKSRAIISRQTDAGFRTIRIHEILPKVLFTKYWKVPNEREMESKVANAAPNAPQIGMNRKLNTTLVAARIMATYMANL